MTDCITIPWLVIIIPCYIYLVVSTIIFIAARQHIYGVRSKLHKYCRYLMEKSDNIVQIVIGGFCCFVVLMFVTMGVLLYPIIMYLVKSIPCVVFV